MFTITRDGNTATIDEDLNVVANDDQLLKDLQDQVDFAQYGDDSALPVLIVLYTNLKLRPDFVVKVDNPDDLDELNGNGYSEETIF